jgi:hypothetical protein
MANRIPGASRVSVEAGVSALAAAVNLTACVVACYMAVRFVLWTWVP